MKSFKIISMITLVAVYALIFVGGSVRSSGAGMGCPDWPTCFGLWIPPVSDSQLPHNYQEIYAAHGYSDTAFNPVHTWTEYLNRLAGVLVGLLVIFTFFASLTFIKSKRKIVIWSGLNVLLIGFEGWLGAYVVSSNLKPLIVSIHMLMALVIIAILNATQIWADDRHNSNIENHLSRYKMPLLAGLVTVIAVGTQLRESIDKIGADIGTIGILSQHTVTSLLLFHGWLAAGISIGLILFLLMLKQNRLDTRSHWLAGILIGQVIVGVVLVKLELPAALQPLHLLNAVLIFGLFHRIYLTLNDPKDTKKLRL